jgi:uncharacterized protein YjiS (DUF1127 family)
MQEKAWFAGSSPDGLFEGSRSAFHDRWSVSMVTLTMRGSEKGAQAHQKNWGAALFREWCRWRLRQARHRQRKVLRDLADDPHLLRDIGVCREEALKEAERRVWDITDIYVHSI